MILEAKKVNSIVLRLSKKENVFISENERLSLETGVVFGEEHYA